MQFLIHYSSSNYPRGLMSLFRVALILTGMCLLFGCYHATIETGLAPSPTVISESFASSWIYGLVPPSTIATASKCPDGVAKVETQLSFVNQLVGFLTLGIYTPMEIKVTCAAKSSAMINRQAPDLVLPEGASLEEIQHLYMKAADMAIATNKPVYIEY